MSARNPAVGAQPGEVFHVPGAAALVRTRGGWIVVHSSGTTAPMSDHHARELIGVERMIRETHALAMRDDGFQDGEKAGFPKGYEAGIVAAPAPLDPGNPEDLRQVAEFVRRYYGDRRLSMHSDYADNVPARFEHAANCLDRGRVEAEQDASDRKLAHKVAAESKEDFTLLAESYQEEIQRHVLAGIRAERERQEAEQ